MIVDLMRNDLGRVCEPGSIEVTALAEARPHTGVWHLVSEVEGDLRAALRGAGGTGPYEPAICVAAPAAGGAPARKLLETLSSQGLVRLSPENPRGAR
jgi:hypothetical protein